MNNFQDKVEIKIKIQSEKWAKHETDFVVSFQKKRANTITTTDDVSCDMQHTSDTQVMYRILHYHNYQRLLQSQVNFLMQFTAGYLYIE